MLRQAVDAIAGTLAALLVIGIGVPLIVIGTWWWKGRQR